LALAVDGPIHKAAIKLLAQAYPHQEAESVWDAWAPHLSSPPTTRWPRARYFGTQVCKPCAPPAPRPSWRGRLPANSSMIYIEKAVLTQIFVTHTATDLSDEEMGVTPCVPHFDHVWFKSYFRDFSPCGSFFLAGLTLPHRTPIGEA